MKIILVAAVSLDGFIADENGSIKAWSSTADQKHFSEMKRRHSLYVMGSTTYESAEIKPEPGVLRVILTRNPNKYKDSEVKNQLEFKTLTAEQFAEQYKSHDTSLLLGGSHVYNEFLELGCVDEVYLTIEPVELGNGTPLLSGEQTIQEFMHGKPVSTANLNDAGTILEHYILKN